MGGVEALANTKHEIYEATTFISRGGPDPMEALSSTVLYYATMDLEDTHVGPGI